MRIQSLRAEFVLAGSALLLVLGWAWEALRRLRGWEQPAIVEYVLDRRTSTGAWLFAAAASVTVAYVLGAFLVQITFERPTRNWIRAIKDERVRQLQSIDERLRAVAENGHPLMDSARATLLDQAFGRGVSHSLDDSYSRDLIHLVQSLGRSSLNEESNSQYNYRRANRQIFVGVLPALIVLPIPVSLTACVAIGGSDGWVFVLSLATTGALGALFFSKVLKPAAKYQEEIAQGLILDAAFLERWHDKEHGPPASQK